MADPVPAEDVKPADTQEYWLTLEEAEGEVKAHEERTGTRYNLSKADPSFGSSSWNVAECKLVWEEGEKYQGTRLDFDGVPFFVLGTKQLTCHYGANTKKFSTSSLSKKPSCPAKVVLKEVIKLPDYKIENNTNYEKKKWSKMIRDDMCCGNVRFERRIYVQLPSLDVHHHTVLTKRVQEIKFNANGSVPHCLVCNGKLSASARSAIPLFTGKIVTSHRRQELCAVLEDILNQQLEKGTVHSSIVCTKCFNLIEDIDSLEEQVITKKQVVVNRYKRTISEINQAPQSPTTTFQPADDDSSSLDDMPQSSKHSRGRGRPPGRPRLRGRGRGRPKGRGQIIKKASDSCPVKLELEEVPEEENGQENLRSPLPLRTIKKEDIMSDLESMEDSQESLMRIEALAAEEGEVEMPIDKEVSMELQEDVLEVVEEVLEKEEKHGKKFSCPQCHKLFLTKAAMRNHIKIHDRLESYECEECEKSFTTKYRLKAHLKIHVDRERPHCCHVCNKSFYTRYHLNTHLRSHEGARNYVCEVCGKALSTHKTLELHILTHTGEKPYQCEICGSTFRQRSNLLTHIKATHYHEKNYHCQLCQRSFVRKRLLEYHINSVHTGHRPYKCEMCNATFVYPHYFRRHIRKHTGDKPHKCHVCEKTFASRENRNAHMFIHSEKKPYECKVCCAGFMRKPLCVSHLAVHGQISNPEAYITFNSPSLLANSHEVATVEEEAAQAIHAVRLAEEADSHQPVEEQTQILREGKVVKLTSRPVHILETDETTRYVIHSSERVTDNNMEHFFAELQGQVVEVRSEDF